MAEPHEPPLAVSSDGVVYVGANSTQIARLDGSGQWELIDLGALPTRRSIDGAESMPGRSIENLAVAPDGTLGAAGSAYSDVDDVEFGGATDEWIDGWRLSWIAAYECEPAAWRLEVATSNDDLHPPHHRHRSAVEQCVPGGCGSRRQLVGCNRPVWVWCGGWNGTSFDTVSRPELVTRTLPPANATPSTGVSGFTTGAHGMSRIVLQPNNLI